MQISCYGCLKPLFEVNNWKITLPIAKKIYQSSDMLVLCTPCANIAEKAFIEEKKKPTITWARLITDDQMKEEKSIDTEFQTLLKGSGLIP